MTELNIYQLDAFTDRPFAGNPAAVIPLDAWLPDAVLQAIALENNLPETAYFVPETPGSDADFHIRWFTPTMEVDLCGHATLASGAALYDLLGWDRDSVTFRAKAGRLSVARRDGMMQLDFPARPAREARLPDGFVEAVGVRPAAFLRAVANMAVLESEAAVWAAKPDLEFVKAMEGDGLILTAPGAASECASRYFAPHAGIPEDPVTGSAHCTIVPYWATRLGRDDIHARQVSARGGDLYCRMSGDRVLIAGHAALYMTGRIHV